MNLQRFGTLLCLASLALAFAPPAQAKLFRNSYVSFELPDQWDCKLTDTEWVCRFDNPAQTRSKEAVIILTAKEVGPLDTLAAYEQHLKTPRQIASALGTPMQSRVVNVVQRQINGQPWVDGMHENSEIRDYYTRYVATVKDRVAVLVTYSAHKSAYARYSADFFRSIQSLRVLNTKGLSTGSGNQAQGLTGAGTYGVGGAGLTSADMGEEFPGEGGGSGGGSATSMILGAAVLLAAAGVYLILKRKPKSKSRR